MKTKQVSGFWFLADIVPAQMEGAASSAPEPTKRFPPFCLKRCPQLDRKQRETRNQKRETRAAPALIALAFSCCVASASAVASEEVPGALNDHPTALVHANLYPVSGPPIPDATLVFEAGRISALGKDVNIPSNARVIDCSGRSVYPGFIAANSALGLTEIPSVRGTVDTIESGDVNPNARAEVSINPDSELIPVARANGVLAALSVPLAPKGLIAGRSALIQLDGWTWEQMTVRAPVGLHVKWPNLLVVRQPDFELTPEAQRKQIDDSVKTLQDFIAGARAYRTAKESGYSGFRVDLRYESAVPVIAGEMPLFITANSALEIKSALDWTRRENLKMVLVGGGDAWRLADQLKQQQVPVIFTEIFAVPERRSDGFDVYYRGPARLAAAGVLFCIASDGTEFAATNERNLPYMAGMAVAHGLEPGEALKAITLNAARIVGAESRLGSLEVGKDATLIVTNGDPLQVPVNVEQAWVQGRPVDLANRQTRLRDKYERKYRGME